MSRKLISSGSEFEQKFGYSRAVIDGDYVFVSGTTGYDYDTMSISDDAKARMKELRGMLGISEDEGENQIRNFFGPELQSVLVAAVDEVTRGNTTDVLLQNMKEKIGSVISNFQLTPLWAT